MWRRGFLPVSHPYPATTGSSRASRPSGLTEGCAVEVLQNVKNRPVLVHVRDSDVALDRGDCMRIEVEVVA